MCNTEEKEPLVSIIVITYNSSKYVLETLESAKAQTYNNIELIIADDASQDNTIQLCENWLSENQQRFIRIRLITVDKNTGIPANCNRGVNASEGEWLKLIAGDDLLEKDCIWIFNKFRLNNPQAKFFASNMNVLLSNGNVGKIILDPFILKGDSCHQLTMLCRFHFIVPAPSLLYHKDSFILLGGFDERFKLVEDYPAVFKILKSGFKFYYVPYELVIYRIHDESISRGPTNKLAESLAGFFQFEMYPFLEIHFPLLYRHFMLENKLINRRNLKMSKFLMSAKIRLSDPYYWYFKIHAIFKNRKKWSTAISLINN